MTTYQPPASLSARQQFRQACSILRHTTRASNPAWYQDALELSFQLHIRTNGPQIAAFYWDRKKNVWSEGPSFTDEIIGNADKLNPVLAEILRHARASGASSLGVVLHVADEFATTELKPEFDNPAALPDLRNAAINDPASILEDSSILATQASWRALPYPAAGSEVIGTTVTISRQYEPLLAAFRELGETANFPIMTQALSAPLVALMGLAHALTPTPGKPFVVILQYAWFTALAFFNEHADLRLIRTLQHRGLRKPTQFHSALNTTIASLEFDDPDLFLMPLGPDVDAALNGNLRAIFTYCRIETLAFPAIPHIPEWCQEPIIAAMRPTTAPTVTSHTFSILCDEQWALQNFLPTPKEILEIYPTRTEIRLLRVLRHTRFALIIITLFGLAVFSYQMVDIMRKPGWSFDPSQVDVMKTRLAKLTTERQKVTQWNNLLDDRSKAWAAMETLARIFPENSGLLVKTYSHTAKPDSVPGQAQVGILKEWKITGFARDEALATLNTLNTREGIAASFNEIARATGNAAFTPTLGNRNLTVNVRTQENNGFKPIPLEETNASDESTYPFSFNLIITQRFESSDPLALGVIKKP
ncbi:MAG: hypothetical protein RLZZ282_1843 [Verrucomicrobiota bacterium]